MNALQHNKSTWPVWFLSATVLAVFCLAVVVVASRSPFFAGSVPIDFQRTKSMDQTPGGLKVSQNPVSKSRSQLDAAVADQILKSYSQLPLSFVANRGQADKTVHFSSRGPGYGLFLTPREAVLSLHKAGSKIGGKPYRRFVPGAVEKFPFKVDSGRSEITATLRMKLVGGDPNPRIVGVDELPGKFNYFRSKDRSHWHTDIPTYAKVKYEKVYPGVDLVFYGNQRQLEYDFIVAPGADPKAVKLEFEGADKVVIDKQGDLVLHTAGGDVRWRKPVAYQTVAGQRRDVMARFVLNKDSSIFKQKNSKNLKSPQIGVQVASYDSEQTLVIDPILVYSSYLGGDDYDSGSAIAVDSSGNAYVTGITYSANFPAVNAKYPEIMVSPDVFVTKFNATGTNVLYSSFLGGDGWDRGVSIKVDKNGNAHVTGATESTDFPVINALFPTLSGNRDAFITKFNANGSQILFSTYLGGDNDEGGNGIALDGSGNAYVTGATNSTNFPAVNAIYSDFGGGGFDAFVTKLNAAGSQIIYSTYLGGDEWDSGYDIDVDGNGNTYVTGATNSTNFPAVNAMFPTLSDIGNDPEFFSSDGFVAKLNSAGTNLVYSTYLGGSFLDFGSGVAADDAGNAYITGATESADFPTANAIYPEYIGGMQDAFVTKISASGSQLLYSTYFGGSLEFSGWDTGSHIIVDSGGNAYVTGTTDSTDFPTVDAVYPNLSGISDAFVTKFNATGSKVLFSTYLGGTDFNRGNGIDVDSKGNAYITGSTSSTDFPTHAKDSKIVSYDSNFNGGDDAFVAKIIITPPEENDVPISKAGPDQTVKAGTTVTLDGSGSSDSDHAPAPLTYLWTQTSGPSVSLNGATTAKPSFTALAPGAYVFRLVVSDGSATSPADSVLVTVIDAEYVLLQAPNGGEVWNEKSKQTIRWISRNIDSKQRMELFVSIDNGVTWTKIASPKNGGDKLWKIPKNRFVSKQALLKICVKKNDTICDTSDKVFSINKVPVADAGVKQRVSIGTKVILDGGGSYDPDNGPKSISYLWSQKKGPKVTLNGPNSRNPSFTPYRTGIYKFGLIVSDDAAESKLDRVTVIVRKTP